MADTKAVAKTPLNAITYKLSNGETVSLNEAVVRKLANNNPNITQGEISLFLELCKYQKLNPFVGEAYLVKYDSTKPASRVVSLSAFARIADEQPTFDGMEDGIIIKKGDQFIDREGCVFFQGEILVGGWATVYRKDRSKPFKARVLLSEYNKGMAMWKSMPAVMINKVAKVTAFRKAFPAAMNGCYAEEELGVVPTADQDAAYDKAFDEAIDIDFVEPVDKNQIGLPVGETDVKRDSDAPKQDFDEEEPDFGIELETLQSGTKKRIPYTEYADNKSKYEKVPESYDRATKTIEVYERG